LASTEPSRLGSRADGHRSIFQGHSGANDGERETQR
jgi:hypothetical protein